MWSKKISGFIIDVFFITVIVFLFYNNFTNFRIKAVEAFNNEGGVQTVQQELMEIDSAIKKDFSHYQECAELYGMGLNALNKNIVGKFEYARSEEGYLHMFKDSESNADFESSMYELKDATNLPVAYVELPPYSTFQNMLLSDYESFYNMDDHGLSDRFANCGIDVIKLQYEGQEFYFRTDGHPTTRGEFNVAERIYKYLEEKGINVSEGDKIFDLSNYDNQSYKFRGGSAKNVGTHYVKLDDFEVYLPQFATDFELFSYENGLYRSGSWVEVAMNNYNELGKSVDNYYVTSFGQWPQPIYSLVNNNTDSDAEILLISDSKALTTFSYLALCCKKITFIDTRYSPQNQYVRSELLTGNYDAVVVVGGPQQIGFESKAIDESIFSHMNVLNWEDTQNDISLDYINNEWVSNQKVIKIDPNVKWMSLSGWAVDINAGTNLSDVYMKVGDKIIRCDYGEDKQVIVDYFGEQYRYTGVKIQFNTQLLYDSEGNLFDSLSFIMVGNDRSYLYEPVARMLEYK